MREDEGCVERGTSRGSSSSLNAWAYPREQSLAATDY